MIKAPLISVVIPAYKKATYIDRLLNALCQQKFTDFEVIVSDAQSQDGTAEVVAGFKNRLDITFIESPPTGPAAGRNKGAAKASGSWLLFLDADDDLDDPDFIEIILKVTLLKGWRSSSAKIKLKNASRQERLGTFLNYRYIKLLSHTKHPVAPGWCIFTHRHVFEKHGGFNENLQLSKDYDYISRVGHEGFGFVEETAYILDLRRLRSEGMRFVINMTRNEIYRHTHHYNLEKTPVKYHFGKHEKRR